ncbi:MAG: hypothetical protein RIR97_1439 [Pseudomonadota bacterium]
MLKSQTTIALAGLLGGVASALLVLAARQAVDATSTFLLILAAMPVLICGLAYGSMASVLSLVATALTLHFAVGPDFAFVILAQPLLPAAWLAHLANMARPASEIGGPDNVMAWYPLSDMLLQLCCLISFSNFVILSLTGYSEETASQLVDLLITIMKQQDPAFVMAPDVILSMKSLYYYLLPLMQSAVWVVLIFAAYYFAALIVRMSTKTLRPREDMPSVLRMNRYGIFLFFTGMVLMAIGRFYGVAGAVLCGAFGGGFLISGLAVFHQRTRGKSWRMPALVLAYMTIFFSAYLFVAVGLMETRRAVALTPDNRNQPD